MAPDVGRQSKRLRQCLSSIGAESVLSGVSVEHWFTLSLRGGVLTRYIAKNNTSVIATVVFVLLGASDAFHCWQGCEELVVHITLSNNTNFSFPVIALFLAIE